jgi:hypothetical protein
MTVQRAGQALLLLFVMVLIVSGCDDSPAGATQEDVAVETTTIAQTDEFLSIDVQIPTFIGFPGADSINQLISTSSDLAVAEIMGAALMMEQNEISNKATLDGSYLCYSFPEDDLYSVWITMANYTGGAHGISWIESYTFSAASGKMFAFSDLFEDAVEGPAYIEEKITEAISASGDFFPGAESELSKYQGDFPFYINGNQIVVYFSVYELAPYAAGITFFAFTDAALADLLRPEIAEAIRGRQPIV